MTKDINCSYYLQYGPYPIPIVYTPSPKAYKKTIKRYGLEPEEYPGKGNARCSYRLCPNGGHVIIITIHPVDNFYTEDPIEMVGLVTHECQHALQFLKDAIGEDPAGMEFEAYTLQALVKGVLAGYQEAHGVTLFQDTITKVKKK